MTFLRAISYLLAPMFLLGLAISAVIWPTIGLLPLFLIVLVFCAFLAAMAVWTGEKAGTLAKVVYSGSRRSSVREQFSANLDRASYLKTRGMYEKALEVIDEYLLNIPEDPEALFLKARILMSSGRHPDMAARCLRPILESTAPDDTFHRWARELLRQIENGNAAGPASEEEITADRQNGAPPP